MEEERFFIKNPPEYALERPEVPKCAIRMRVQPQAAWRVRDCFSPDQIMQEPEGSFLVDFSYPENEFLMDFLMSFGSRAEVLSPVHIRQAIMLEAKNLAESYKEYQKISDNYGVISWIVQRSKSFFTVYDKFKKIEK